MRMKMKIEDTRTQIVDYRLFVPDFKTQGFRCWLWGPKKQYLDLYLWKSIWLKHVAEVFFTRGQVDFINVIDSHEEVLKRLNKIDYLINTRVYLK